MVDEERQQQQLVAEERGEGVVRRQEQRQGRLYHRGRGRGRGRGRDRDVGGGRAQMQALLSTVDQGLQRSKGSARGGC